VNFKVDILRITKKVVAIFTQNLSENSAHLGCQEWEAFWMMVVSWTMLSRTRILLLLCMPCCRILNPTPLPNYKLIIAPHFFNFLSFKNPQNIVALTNTSLFIVQTPTLDETKPLLTIPTYSSPRASLQQYYKYKESTRLLYSQVLPPGPFFFVFLVKQKCSLEFTHLNKNQN